jgi:hypothetical protein
MGVLNQPGDSGNEFVGDHDPAYLDKLQAGITEAQACGSM